MRPVVYAVRGERTSPKFAKAFALGCSGRMVTVPPVQLYHGPFASFCTPPVWPLLAQSQADGRDWYYGDHGHFKRGVYYRVTKNAYQPDGLGTASAKRFLALGVELKPWTRTGSAIVLCPNSPIYMKHYTGIDVEPWIAAVTANIQKVSDRRIVLRWKTDAKERPLAVDLRDAWVVVVFSSAAAVEALAAGVPVCTLAPWASTSIMGITDVANVELPHRPAIEARDQFLFNLADSQWTLDEMKHGLAWRALQAHAA